MGLCLLLVSSKGVVLSKMSLTELNNDCCVASLIQAVSINLLVLVVHSMIVGACQLVFTLASVDQVKRLLIPSEPM